MQEFDLIPTAPGEWTTITAAGTTLSYVAPEDGNVRASARVLEVRADGVQATVKQGETLRLQKTCSQWQIRANGYACIRIGAGFVSGPAGVQRMEVENSTLYGTEWRVNMASGTAAGYNFCGIQNNYTDKTLVVRSWKGKAAAGSTGLILAAASLPQAACITSAVDLAWNCHPVVGLLPNIRVFSGQQVAQTANPPTEYFPLFDCYAYNELESSKTAEFVRLDRAPVMVPPSFCLIMRGSVAGQRVAAEVCGSLLDVAAL